MCSFLNKFSLFAYRGLEAVKGSERVYLEAYTSLLLVPKEKLVSLSINLNTYCYVK